MNWKASLILSASALLVASCGPTVTEGDFCDVAEPIYYGSVESADWNAENDPDHADDVAYINTQGERRCGWSF